MPAAIRQRFPLTLALALSSAVAFAQTPGQLPASPPPAASAPAPAQLIATLQGGTIHGTVVAGKAGTANAVPLPGVAVTATNTLTGRKYTAATDIDGVYALSIPRNGRYVVRAELTGFATTTEEVVLNATSAGPATSTTNFGLELASRAAAAEAQQTASNSANGLQNLSLLGNDSSTTESAASAGNSGVSMPTLANLDDSVTGDAAASATDSITVSGQSGQMNGLANFSEDEIRQRVEEAVSRARANGMLAPGADPTNAIVGALGPMMGGRGPGGGRGGRGGGGGGGGRGGFGGRGAFRNFNPAQPHGGLMYSGEFASLDSAPWSPTLRPITNPGYAKNSFGGSIAGSPYIPGLTKPSNKQFVFINFNGRRNTTPEILTGTVPTAAERGNTTSGDADLSALVQNINGKPQTTAIYNPANPQQQFANNIIPAAQINSVARNILATYYPLCNVPGCENATSTTGYNYQTVTTAGQNSANLAARYVRNFGQNAGQPFGRFRRQSGPPSLRQNMNANFSYSHAASDQRNIIPILGGATLSDGYNFGLGYTIGYGRLSNSTNVNVNRSHALTSNYFTDTTVDPALQVGLSTPADQAIATRPNFYNGLPSLQLTNFTSLTNTNPSDTVGQTISFSDSISWRRKHHNMRFGLDVRRVQQNILGGSDSLGTIVFTGYNTESQADQQASTTVCVPSASNHCSNTAQASSGAALADFLLGLPQQSKVQAGLSKIYLRENVFDAYAQDDFRVSAHLSLVYGVRYEYFAPYTEKNGHLVNLTGVTTHTTSVGCVTPGGISLNGLTCAAGPTDSLIHPDRTMFAPRFGVAYSPPFLKETVLRAGYGINYNTGQFQTFAKMLAYQPPFAAVQNNVLGYAAHGDTPANNTGCYNPTYNAGSANMTLAHAFNCSNKLYQNSFAVDPNYRLGMVQVYNADIQRTLPWGVVVNLGYNGSHGSNLDVTRAPNHTSSTVTTPDAVAFTYEDSIGESTFNALTVNARKRLQHGISLQATYVYSHSIDDASSFGGGSNASSIQNDADLHAERSNSSFDRRHKVYGNWLYELPFGPNRAFLNKGGVWSKVLDGFGLSGNFTVTSGQYYTPSYQSTAAQIAAGGTYTLRPDRVFSQPITGPGTLHEFFNPNAFTFPSSSTGYGTASRYSIEGPGTLSVSAALSRTVQLGDTRSLETRITAENVFNTVQYSGINTTLDSATFGQVTSAAAMRQITFTARYRF